MKKATNNYYLEHTVENYPALQEDIEVSVAVIGGGFTGVNTALELSARGKSVALLEAHHIGWGASGRNGGQMIRGFSTSPENYKWMLGDDVVTRLNQLANDTVGIVKDRIKKHSIDCDFVDGYCHLALNKSQLRWCEEEVGDDPNHTFYDQAKLKQDIIDSDRYLGGLVDTASAHLHPYKLVTAEAIVASKQGAHIFEESPVHKVSKTGNGYTVLTSQGRVKCDIVVYCCNAYINKLHWGVDSRSVPASSYIIATEPLTDKQLSQTIKKNMAFCDLNIVLDYFRLSADKRLLFGGRCNYSGIETTHIEKYLQPRMEDVFPSLKGVRIDYKWGGKIAVGFNRLPQIGRMNEQEYYACAYSGHGVNVTHLAAKLLADKICGTSTDFDIFNAIWHFKFPPINWIRGPLTSLAMMTLRLKDKILG